MALPDGPRTMPTDEFVKGLWRENPVFVQVLGMCPVLAVTNTAINALAMGLATTFVMLMSNLLVSTLRNYIPKQVRIATYILIIATFVTIVDYAIQAISLELHKALGAFISLIVVNCLILGRQEAFASKRPVGRALLDATGTGFGFIIALLIMGAIREVVGSGTFLGRSMFGPSYEPWVVMILPPGGFLTIGLVLLGLNWFHDRRVARAKMREEAEGLAAERVA